ncbi:MAG: DUF5611 family protein [Thermoplasmatota archaeon]
MQTYPVKRGHMVNTDLKMIFEAAFDSVEEDGEWLAGSYGTMPKIRVKYDSKTAFTVDTESDKSIAKKVADGDAQAMELAVDTQRRWNDFLEGATGYDTKTRKKKMEQAAKKDK